MNTCPVYRRSGGHSYHATVPGPIGSVLNPLHNAAKYDSLPFACSLCGSCTDVCPVKIPLHHQLYSFRRVIRFRNLLPASKRWSMWAASAVLNRPWLYSLSGKVARKTLPLIPRWAIYNSLNPWGKQRELPAPPKKSFRELWREEQKNGPG